MGGKRAKQLIIKALDEWKQLAYYHQLIEILHDEANLEILQLHQQCYLKLAEKPRERLDATLRALRSELDNLV